MNESSPINLEYLQESSGGDPEFEQEILELFVEDAQIHLAAAKAAIAAQDAPTLRQEAHHLKGSSGNVGANSMYQVAAQLEAAALKQQADQFTPLYTELENAYAEASNWIAQHFQVTSA